MRKVLIFIIVTGLLGTGGISTMTVHGENRATLQNVADTVALAVASRNRLKSKADQYDLATLRQTAHAIMDEQFPDYSVMNVGFSEKHILRVDAGGQFTMLPKGMWTRNYVSYTEVRLLKNNCEISQSESRGTFCLPVEYCRLEEDAEETACIPTGEPFAR